MRWSWWLLLALLVLPTLEIAAIIAVGRAIGGWPTLALLLVESALGAWLVKREGARAWTALSGALTTGRMPSRELTDAALVLVGGTLLLTPGFVTDLAGFVCILPGTRALVRPLLATVVQRKLLGAMTVVPRGPGAPPRHGQAQPTSSPAEDIITGEIVDRD
ncbi:MAG: FxsA family protein [Dermatophilaceae bacterium]|jgi:UPF0716 protein FxsA